MLPLASCPGGLTEAGGDAEMVEDAGIGAELVSRTYPNEVAARPSASRAQRPGGRDRWRIGLLGIAIEDAHQLVERHHLAAFEREGTSTSWAMARIASPRPT